MTPSLETISIKLVEDALLCEMVMSEITSVPALVWKVKALVTVAVPGAMIKGDGSVVEADVRVVDSGVVGLPAGSTANE